MKWKIFKFPKENLLWVPLVIVSLVNFFYMLLALLTLYMGITDINLRTIELRQEYPLRFFLTTIILEGWGMPVIVFSNLGGAITGLLLALVYRKRISEYRKKSIKIFLIFFYTIIFGSFIFLVLSN